MLPELVEAAARVGDPDLARDALERLAETTQPAGTGSSAKPSRTGPVGRSPTRSGSPGRVSCPALPSQRHGRLQGCSIRRASSRTQAGSESGAGVWINDVAPELLRAAKA